MIRLHVGGASVREIAKVTGKSTKTVQSAINAFKPIFNELANVEEFRKVKPDILDAALLTFLKSAVQQEKLDKASVNNLAYAARQCFDMHRLQTGQSTSNTAVMSFSRSNLPEA